MRFFLFAYLAMVGCSGPTGGLCEPVGPAEVEVGVPDPITFLDFEPLTPGGDIPLSSNGQTFLAVQIALRAINVRETAEVTLRVTSQVTGMTSTATTTERLRCRDDGRRYLVPVVVSSEDLGPDAEIQDSMVDVELEVSDADGNRATATSSGIVRRL